MNAIEQIKYLNDIVTKITSGQVKIKSVVTRQGAVTLCGIKVEHGERKEGPNCLASRGSSILETPATLEAEFLETPKAS